MVYLTNFEWFLWSISRQIYHTWILWAMLSPGIMLSRTEKSYVSCSWVWIDMRIWTCSIMILFPGHCRRLVDRSLYILAWNQQYMQWIIHKLCLKSSTTAKWCTPSGNINQQKSPSKCLSFPKTKLCRFIWAVHFKYHLFWFANPTSEGWSFFGSQPTQTNGSFEGLNHVYQFNP